jgi:hypothetical protein
MEPKIFCALFFQKSAAFFLVTYSGFIRVLALARGPVESKISPAAARPWRGMLT